MPKVTSPPTAEPAWPRAACMPSDGSTTPRRPAQRSTSLSVVGRHRGLPLVGTQYYPAILSQPTDARTPLTPLPDLMTPRTDQGEGHVAYRGAGRAVYLNLTNRCSCACRFCLREWTDGVYGADLRLEREPELDDVLRALELELSDEPADEVVFCGFGEPTMRLDLVLAVTEWLPPAAPADPTGHQRARSAAHSGCGRAGGPGGGRPRRRDGEPQRRRSAGLRRHLPTSVRQSTQVRLALCRTVQEVLASSTTLTAVDYPGADLTGCEALAAALGAGFRARSLAAPRADERVTKGDRR